MTEPSIEPNQEKPESSKKQKFSMPNFSLPSLSKGKQNMVVEIGDDWLKMVCFEGSGRGRKVLGYGAVPIRDLAEIEVSQKIDAFIRDHSWRPQSVVVSHPAHNLTSRILHLPSKDPIEISDMVDLQAVKQTPYSREEITTGFYIIDTDATGYSEVLVVISHRETVSRYFRTVEIAGLLSQRITLSLEGTQNWLELVEAKEKTQESSITLLLDVDHANSDMLVLKDQKLIFSRSLGLGVKNITPWIPSVEEGFLAELQRTLEADELKDQKIDKMILTGAGGEAVKNLGDALSRQLNIPCEVTPALSETIEKKMDSQVVRPEEGASEVSFASVLGLALSPKTMDINLIPAEIVIRKTLEERARDLAVMGTLLLALVSLASLVCFSKIQQRTNYLDELKKDYASIKGDAQEIDRLVSKMKLAKDQIVSSGGFLDVMRDVSEVMPPNITLSGFQYDGKERSVTLRGLSREMSSVFKFLSTLEAVPHLEFVKTRNVTKRTIEDREFAEFEIVANIPKLNEQIVLETL